MNAKTESDSTILRTLTEQNRWLTEEVKRGIDQLAAINSVAATVSQTLDMQVTLDRALEAVLGRQGIDIPVGASLAAAKEVFGR